MLNFAHAGAGVAKDDSAELILLALGALAIGLLLGYMLGKSQMPAIKGPKPPAKKAKK